MEERDRMSDLRDIATLCKEIDCLTAQVDTLRKQRDEARKELADAYSKSAQVIADLSANLCTASALERKRLTAERDEARRRLCIEWTENGPVRLTKEEIAMRYGWDCFKEAK